MKNDDQIKNQLKIKELKSANKSSSKKQFSKNFSQNKFSRESVSNNFTSKFDNLTILNSDKKDLFNFSVNKLYDNEIPNNLSVSPYNLSNIACLKSKKKENRNKNQQSYSSSAKKSMTSKRLFNVNPQNLGDNRNNLINNINNNNINIENINNIQNYNSYHIIKKSNSINKFDNFLNNNLSGIGMINVQTPISYLEKTDKNSHTDTKNMHKNRFSIYNYNEFEMNGMLDPNPVKVVVRFRPMNNIELEMLDRNFGRQSVDFKSNDTIEIINQMNSIQTFTLDRVFNPSASQKEIFDQIAKPLIDDVLKGYNGTIFTYGQSGSGKTFTMYGEDILDGYSQGIIPRSIIEIFNFINDDKNRDIKFELKFSMLEIYKENIYDLLNPETKSSDLKIKEHRKKGIYVENLTEIYITSQEEFLLLIHEAEKLRSVSETSLNKNSSRSHLLFQLQITQKLQDDTERRGFLNLVDLAGSEKVSKTHAMGDTLEEAKKINLSLSNLGNVIYALASNSDYIPYRDSKLTRILQDSLGGNSKTLLIVNCSIHSYNSEETISTLQFAKRAKKIKNKVKINIKRSTEQLEAIIEYLSSKLKNANEQIEKLKNSLMNQSEIYSRKESIGFNELQNNFNNQLINNKNESNLENLSFVIGENRNNFEILSDIKKNINLFDKIIEMNSTDKDYESKKNNSNVNNFNSENFEFYNTIDKEKIELEKTIRAKNSEIEELNDRINKLSDQNNRLTERVQVLSNDTNLDKFILTTENSMKEFIKDLTKTYDNVRDSELNLLKENLSELKNYQIETENKYLDIIRDLTELKESDLLDKMNLIGSKNKVNLNSSKYTDIDNVNNKIHVKNYPSNQIGLNNNYLKDFDLNTEREITILENVNMDDEFNNSINTFNKLGMDTTKDFKKNTLKFTLKRTFNENTIPADLISNISKNQTMSNINLDKNLIPRDKSNSLKKNELSNMNKDKSRSERVFNTNFVKRLNSFDNNNQKNQKADNNIVVIENLLQLSPDRLDRNNSNNMFNTIQNDKNQRKKLISNNYEFNLTCDDLFKRIELSLKKFTEKILLSETSEKSENLFENKNLKNDCHLKKNIFDLKKIHIETDSSFKNSEDNLASFTKENDNNIISNYNKYIILSYRKIFSNNKFYSKQILDEFLRNLEQENLYPVKNEENNEISVLYNTKGNTIDQNKSSIKTDRRNDNSIIQEDFLSVNEKMERKENIKILNDLTYTNSRRELEFTLNKNNNINLDNINEEKGVYNCDSKVHNKLKSGFVCLMLKVIYYEKINFELLARLSLDLKIFHNETSYRKKLSKNFPQFISIFENYMSILDDLKKMKLRKEHEETKINSYQIFMNNVNQMNPVFRNTFGKEENIPIQNITNVNILNRSTDSIRNVEMNEDAKESNTQKRDQHYKLNENKERDSNYASNNKQTENYSIPGFMNNLGSFNTKKYNNVVKSIPKRQCALQNNITFNNYNMLLNNRISNSHIAENSVSYNQDQIICQFCNNVNKIPVQTSNLAMNSFVPPFKLGVNNENSPNEKNIRESSKGDILNGIPNKRFGLEWKSSDNINRKDSDFPSGVDFSKKSSDKNIYELKLMNNERSPDKELILNLKYSSLFNSTKAKPADLNNINSINNTPAGIRTFNLYSPNYHNSYYNVLNTNEKEKHSVRGKFDNLRQSLVSNTSNRKINDEGNFTNELKLTKKECILYKNCFDSLTNEINNFKFYEKNKEEALDKFYNENRIIFEKEVTCFWKALKVYKEIFSDQIKSKDNKINEMSKVFDDMVIGENSILLNNGINLNNTTYNNLGVNETYMNLPTDKVDTSKLKEDFLKNLAVKRKNNAILDDNPIKDKEFLKLAEAFYKEEGTATKKLDYITIEIKNSPEMIKLKYGSGLNKHIPTRSPLFKGFTHSLVGDDGLENVSNDED